MQALDGFMSRPGDVRGEAELGDLEGFLKEALDAVHVDEKGEANEGGPAGKAKGAPKTGRAQSFFEAPADPVGGFYEGAQCLTAVSPRGVLSLDANMATGQTGATGSGATAPPQATMNDWTEYAESQGAATGSERLRGLESDEARKKRNRLAQARMRKRKREREEQMEGKMAKLEEEKARLASQLKRSQEEVQHLKMKLADRNTDAPTAASPDAPAAAMTTAASKEGRWEYSADLARDILLSGGVEVPSAGKNKVAGALRLLFTSVFLVSEYVPASEDKEQSVRFLGGLGRAMKQAMGGKMPTARGEGQAGISGREAAPGQPKVSPRVGNPATQRPTPAMPHPTDLPFQRAVPPGYRTPPMEWQRWPGGPAHPEGGPAHYYPSFGVQRGAPPGWPAATGPPQYHAAGIQEHPVPPQATGGWFGPPPAEPSFFDEDGPVL